jgi:hypothetical protein
MSSALTLFLPIPRTTTGYSPRLRSPSTPAPQMSLPGFAGERKRSGLMSPSPNALGMLGAGEGWLMIGMVVRVIRLQSLKPCAGTVPSFAGLKN